MRSRYAAYVLGNVDYLIATHAMTARGRASADATRRSTTGDGCIPRRVAVSIARRKGGNSRSW